MLQQSVNGHERPNLTWNQIISEAIEDSPERMVTLQELFKLFFFHRSRSDQMFSILVTQFLVLERRKQALVFFICVLNSDSDRA